MGVKRPRCSARRIISASAPLGTAASLSDAQGRAPTRSGLSCARKTRKSLARNVFLGNLTLEFGAVGAVLGHGFHTWKLGEFRSIPNLHLGALQNDTQAQIAQKGR